MKVLHPSGRHTRPLPHPTDVLVMSRPARPRRVPLLGRILVVAVAVLTLSGAFLATRLSFSTATPANATAQTSSAPPTGDLQLLRKQITATRTALAQLPHLSAVLTETGNKQTTISRLQSQLRAHLAKLQAAEQLLTTQRPSPTPSSQVSAVIAYAKAQLGKPYQWGAAGPYAFDCSGLVQQAWKAAGVTLPRTTGDQAQTGTRTTRARLQPGDLIFTNDFGHVQLYIGGDQVIQARHTGTLVQITSWPDPQYVDAYVHIS
jgi:cell wall-associated NlpC family hydrolase